MDNLKRIEIINSYQVNPCVHPLTCGNNLMHENLVPIVMYDKVILRCLDCEYLQFADDEFVGLLAELDTHQRQAMGELLHFLQRFK